MATVTEVKAEQDYHWCSECGLYLGFSMDDIGYDLSEGPYGDDYELITDDNLKEWMEANRVTIRICTGGHKMATNWDDPDPEILDIARGDLLYKCDDCGSLHGTEYVAENCC